MCMCVWRHHTQLLSHWSHFARSVASEEQIWTLCALFGSGFQLCAMPRVALGLAECFYSPDREVMAEPPMVVFPLTVCGSFKYSELPTVACNMFQSTQRVGIRVLFFSFIPQALLSAAAFLQSGLKPFQRCP